MPDTTPEQARELAERRTFTSPVAGHWDTDEGTEMANCSLIEDRAELTKGDLSDLALANGVFMVSRNDLDLIVWQTAAKERIRWLSAHLAASNSALRSLADQVERVTGDDGADDVETLAQWLHDEGGFDEAWTCRTWPEHPGDTGQRDGGFVKIVPSDVQAKFRDVARRYMAGRSARLAAVTKERDALREALTPSGETKYAYSGEFSWTYWWTDLDGLEQGSEMTVPWTTIKEIMAAIVARAALKETDQ